MLRVLEVTVKKTFPLVRLAFLRVVPRAVEASVGILFATTHPYLYTGPHLKDLEPSSALKRLIIRTMTAITNSRWIKLPPTWPSKPRSQSTSKMTIIIQSTGVPSLGLNFRRPIYSEIHLFAKLFQTSQQNGFHVCTSAFALKANSK